MWLLVLVTEVSSACWIDCGPPLGAPRMVQPPDGAVDVAIDALPLVVAAGDLRLVGPEIRSVDARGRPGPWSPPRIVSPHLP